MGNVALTGHFTHNGSTVPKLALNLAQCEDCGLVQLLNSYSHELLYGENYGYESHFNKSMQLHLTNKARILEKRFLPNRGGIVMDIASNDGTLLSGYSGLGIIKIGIDPILEFLNDFYPRDAVKIPKFFDQSILDDVKPNSVDLVTSLSVLYDLERPIDFVQTVQKILKLGGVWHFEQSYLPSMLYNLSYDTICHEHLLYLSMRDIQKMLCDNGFSIIATIFLGSVMSSFSPVLSLYRRTRTCDGNHSSIFAVRIVCISYELERNGSPVVSTGTIATHPSSHIDMTTSCIKALPV
jgi:hypothetical protein